MNRVQRGQYTDIIEEETLSTDEKRLSLIATNEVSRNFESIRFPKKR